MLSLQYFFVNITLLIYTLKTPVESEVSPPIRSRVSFLCVPKEQLTPCHCKRWMSGVLKISCLTASFLLF